MHRHAGSSMWVMLVATQQSNFGLSRAECRCSFLRRCAVEMRSQLADGRCFRDRDSVLIDAIKISSSLHF